MTIPYRIDRIETSQFAIFPDKMVNGEKVSVEVNLDFSLGEKFSPLKNTVNVKYIQNDSLLMIIEVICDYAISDEGIQSIQKEGKIPVDFLRYVGSFSVGIVRGIIHARTEGTILSSVILPPVNLDNAIDKDIVIKTSTK